MDLSISIVSYNTSDLLKRCLTSLYKHTKGISFEVIVVDNNSKDDSAKMVKKEFPQATLIANKQNTFFAKGNNQALKKAKGRYFVVFAPDAYLVDNVFKKLVQFMDKHPDVGAVDGLEIYENGEILKTGSRFSTPLIDFYELSLIGKRIKNKRLIDAYRIVKKDRNDTFPIDVGCDAFLTTKKSVMDAIGGYDEKLLLYYTENDLCLRIKQQGYKIVHFGQAKVMHTVSVSVSRIGWKKTDIYYRDLLWYYKKHGYRLTGTLLFLLLKGEETLLKLVKKSL